MNIFRQTANRAQLVLWRVAAGSTGAVLQHRAWLIRTLPYVQIVIGGAGAYFMGRWIGELVRAHWL